MRFKERAAEAWAAFNEWRLKGWPFRVVVLLLIFAVPLYERLSGNELMAKLVGYAIESTMMNCEPKLANAKYHYYKIRDIQALRYDIKSYFETGSYAEGVMDGEEFAILRLEGINPADLRRPSTYAYASSARMERLADFAKRYAIVSPNYSVKELRKRAFFAAQAEVQMDNAPAKAEIAECFKFSSRLEDAGTFGFWKNGWEEFAYVLLDFLAYLSPLQTLGLWLLLCFLLSSYLSTRVNGSIKAPACLGLPLLATLCCFAIGNYERISFYFQSPSGSCFATAFFLFVLASSLKGMKGGLSLAQIRSIALAAIAAWLAISIVADSYFISDYLRMRSDWDYLCSCVFNGRGIGSLILPPWSYKPDLSLSITEFSVLCSVLGVLIMALMFFFKRR